MGFGIDLFKYMDNRAVELLATIPVITFGLVPVLAMLGVNFNTYAILIPILLVGLVLVVDSGIKSFGMPSGWRGWANLVILAIGASLVISTLGGLFGITGIPGVGFLAGFAGVGLIGALFISN